MASPPKRAPRAAPAPRGRRSAATAGGPARASRAGDGHLDEATTAALVAAAAAARRHAYAPYSNFQVGAALLDEQGRIHAGCNIENAAYPQGVCAEAAAIAQMVGAGGRRIAAVAVFGVSEWPVTPCGGCRQKIREFAADATPVLVADPSGLRARYTLGELLPASFGPHHLEPPV